MVKRMKVIIISLILSFAIPALTFASTGHTGAQIYLDEVQLKTDISPIIESGTTLIPFRNLFEALGAQVQWDEKNRLVLAVYRSTAVKLKVGSETIEVNGKPWQMPLAVKIHLGRTMIPLRAVSESFGLKVNWDGINRVIRISSPSAVDLAIINGRQMLLLDFAGLPAGSP